MHYADPPDDDTGNQDPDATGGNGPKKPPGVVM